MKKVEDPCWNCDGMMREADVVFTDFVFKDKGKYVTFTTKGLVCDCGSTAVGSRHMKEYDENLEKAYADLSN